jgi:hypothetical protein
MAVSTALCPHCNADLMASGIMPWMYTAGAAGPLWLFLCMSCSKVLGILPRATAQQGQPGSMSVPGAFT